MRTFQITPTSPGEHVHHLWKVIATAEDGTVTTVQTYATMQEATAAKETLEQSEMGNRR
jgi:hypothetical protein